MNMTKRKLIELYYLIRYWPNRTYWQSIALFNMVFAHYNGIEHIVGVADIIDGLIYQLPMPYRHNHCFKLAYDELGEALMEMVNDSQGFITSTGRYVNREEGLIIAKEANQLLSRHFHQRELFSESLW